MNADVGEIAIAIGGAVWVFFILPYCCAVFWTQWRSQSVLDLAKNLILHVAGLLFAPIWCVHALSQGMPILANPQSPITIFFAVFALPVFAISFEQVRRNIVLWHRGSTVLRTGETEYSAVVGFAVVSTVFTSAPRCAPSRVLAALYAIAGLTGLFSTAIYYKTEELFTSLKRNLNEAANNAHKGANS